MSDAFQRGWDVSKIDFRLDNTSSRDNTLGWSSPFGGDVEYQYRVPTGRDKDGNLLYEGEPRSVKDSSWINLGAYSNPEEELTDDPRKDPKETIQDRIISTIIHESMHDADREIGSPAREFGFGRAKGRPRFGNRFTDMNAIGGRDNNVPVSVIDSKGMARRFNEEGFEGFSLKPDAEVRMNPSPPEIGSGLARDETLAAETMAYLGQYPFDEKRRNLNIARHTDVSPTDTAFLLDKYGTWKNFYGNKKMNPKNQKRKLRIGYKPNFPLEHTPSERIRRNLINALDDTAMTRMTQSGQFLENPLTSIVGGFGEGSTSSTRPIKAQLDAARKETSKARRAINAHWKKIEAGKAPSPNSIDDLPQKIQELIGQQQIRAKLGRMRGLESNAIDRGSPAKNLDKKYRSLVVHADSREEKVNLMRKYAKELLQYYKPSEPKMDRYGDYSDYQEWIGDLPVLREMFSGKSNRPFDDDYDEFAPNYIHNYPELMEEFSKLADLETLVPRKGGKTIGNVYDILPSMSSFVNETNFGKKPASIPLSDWIEMYNYNVRENRKRQKNE